VKGLRFSIFNLAHFLAAVACTYTPRRGSLTIGNSGGALGISAIAIGTESKSVDTGSVAIGALSMARASIVINL
jgi:hypothetical protein